VDQKTPTEISPYLHFTRTEWAGLRAGMPLTLNEEEIARLRGLNDPMSLSEVIEIYLPVSRLLTLYVEAVQNLYDVTRRFLGNKDGVTPFIIGIAGSVAVGKSTTARVLRALLARWANTPRVELVTTDGFLLPNAVLEREGLMERKGFPESYDLPALLTFLSGVKAGKAVVSAPVYSHLTYDIIPGERIAIERPDILIVEGLNVLQPPRAVRAGVSAAFVSDFFDFSIYIDANEAHIHRWYVDRFMQLRETAFRDRESYFHRHSKVSDAEARAIAEGLWTRINLVNLRENILPTRRRADLILTKNESHAVEQVALRRL
jgi:type I pantothenate kinase